MAVTSSDVSCWKDSSSKFYTYQWGASNTLGYLNQVGDIFLPSAPIDTPTPVVVLVHGGYWYDQYRRNTNNGSSMVPLAYDLQARGFIAVNLEYRRAATYGGGDTGGFTETFNDVTDGVDALNFVKDKCGFSENLDVNRIVLVGHSAGGHLALWRTLQFGITSADRDATSCSPLTCAKYLNGPLLNPIAAIGLAAVSDFACACSSMCSQCIKGCDLTASCSAITNFMSYGTYGKTQAQVGANLKVWSPLQMLQNANQNATSPIAIKLLHATSDTTVRPAQSNNFKDASASLSMIHTSVGSYSGGHFDVIRPTHPSWACGASQFLTGLFANTPNPVCTVVNFESGSSGWTHDPSSTCKTGKFVVGTPSLMTDSDVVTQVCGDHTTGTGKAFYTSPNTSAGAGDVDGGVCIAMSPTYSVTQQSSVSIWYFHGQRDEGDDQNGDYFSLEMSTNNGLTWGTTLASYGDKRVNAVWQKATATVPAASQVKFRMRVSDGSAAEDFIEAGVDDLVICSI